MDIRSIFTALGIESITVPQSQPLFGEIYGYDMELVYTRLTNFLSEDSIARTWLNHTSFARATSA